MANVTLHPEQGMTHFVVRDLAWDAANSRLLALGVRYGFDAYGTQQDFVGGAAIYEVDLATGELVLVHTILDEFMIIHAMTVDNDGIIYIYNTYNQYYTAIDLEKGIYENIATGTSLSANGDDDGRHDLYFDSLSGLIYHLFTSNSTFYRMYTLDPATDTLTLVDYVGEVIREGRAYKGDAFSGLTFVFDNGEEEPKPEPQVIASGWSGYTLWTLTDDGTLTVSPSGQTLDNGKCNMRNYSKDANGVLTLPWSDYAELIETVVVEEGVNAVGQMAFYSLPNLKTVVLAESVDEIRNYAFKNCSALESVNLENVAAICEGAFYGCSSLTDVTFSGFVTVGEWAFAHSGVTYP